MNKTRVRLAALLLAVSFALSGCSLVKNIGGSSGARTKTITRPAVESAELQFTHPAAGEPVAVFDTTAGVFRAVLFPEQAPQASPMRPAWMPLTRPSRNTIRHWSIVIRTARIWLSSS